MLDAENRFLKKHLGARSLVRQINFYASKRRFNLSDTKALELTTTTTAVEVAEAVKGFKRYLGINHMRINMKLFRLRNEREN